MYVQVKRHRSSAVARAKAPNVELGQRPSDPNAEALKQESCEERFARWIDEARQGSTKALGRLIESSSAYLLSIANRVMANSLRTKLDPEDLVQETALQAHCCFADFRGQRRDELLGWLRQILLHQAADINRYYQRARKRDVSRELSLELCEDGVPELWAKQANPAQQVLLVEETVRLDECVGQLPVRMRDAFLLRHQEQRSFREIGNQLECSCEAARKLCSRGATKLRQKLCEPSPLSNKVRI